MTEILLAIAIPAAQLAGLLVLGLVFRVDRNKTEGGDGC